MYGSHDQFYTNIIQYGLHGMLRMMIVTIVLGPHFLNYNCIEYPQTPRFPLGMELSCVIDVKNVL